MDINVPPTNHIKVLDEQGWVGLLNTMGAEVDITNAARVSFGKRKDKFDDKDLKLMNYLIKNQHMTPFEHITMTFSVHCPLFVRSQWMRHRTFSFNEISRRYTDEEITFYLPKALRIQSENNKQASVEGSHIDDEKSLICDIDIQQIHVFQLYKKLLDAGVCREQARGVLPQNMMTTFWATVDLRNLLGFLKLRCDEHAQVEIREYANAIKELIRPIYPHVISAFENQEFK